ncbi:MAG: NADH-quinone oxidoreductase subunit NuoF [Acidobacteria bacterium]|nr:NADH-quinone oxidoreductase subunit NuoF [Acidobacteriota bacterium]
MEKILTRNWGKESSHTLEVYLRDGGYEALRKALREFEPRALIDEIKKSNLRGRGGAGFPMGQKMSFVPRGTGKPVYLCVNADESEPGTFKDRYILERDPHMMIEGALIACYAIGAQQVYVYIRGEFRQQARILDGAIREAYQGGFLGRNILGNGFDLDMYWHTGAGAYICGEETGLLESLEGKKAWPRLRPPFPAVAGLYNFPTLIHNVETLACLPHIVARGGEWFAKLGVEKNGGTKIYGLSGHVREPGLYELPMGIKLRELIYQHGGGIRGGRQLKGVIPGGASCPILRAEEIDVEMDFDALQKIGSMFGTGCPVVMDETTCMVEAAYSVAKFFAHESCGQCTPCREGAEWIRKIMHRILNAQGRPDDVDHMLDLCDNIQGKTICALGDAAAMAARGFLRKFRDEFEFHVRHGRCELS